MQEVCYVCRYCGKPLVNFDCDCEASRNTRFWNKDERANDAKKRCAEKRIKHGEKDYEKILPNMQGRNGTNRMREGF